MGNQHADIANSLLAGRYRLGRVVGRGGMAEVRSAYDELAGRTVAVKLYRTDLDQPESAARREAEGRIARELEHPGLVTVYETSFDGARAFLVMELVLGSTLEELAAAGPLSVPQAADLGAQLADTLASVHAAGIVHRDVKPSNVLLASAGRGRWRTKLTDFGISRRLDATRLTSTGLLVGTARYLSPEQASGEPAGFASDVYALGLVLLECVTGTKCFPGNIVETTVARLTRPPDIPDSLGSLGVLLAQMTAREPHDRPCMAEVADELRTLAHADVTLDRGVEPVVPTAPPVAPAAGPRPRQLSFVASTPLRSSLLGAAAAVALVLSGLGLFGGEPAGRATASGDPGAGAEASDAIEPDGNTDVPPAAASSGNGSGAQAPAVNNVEQPGNRRGAKGRSTNGDRRQGRADAGGPERGGKGDDRRGRDGERRDQTGKPGKDKGRDALGKPVKDARGDRGANGRDRTSRGNGGTDRRDKAGKPVKDARGNGDANGRDKAGKPGKDGRGNNGRDKAGKPAQAGRGNGGANGRDRTGKPGKDGRGGAGGGGTGKPGTDKPGKDTGKDARDSKGRR